MNISKFFKILLLIATLSVVSLNAQDEQKLSCDESYDICVEKCNNNDSSSDSCYNTCDEKYNKCTEPEENEDSEESQEK